MTAKEYLEQIRKANNVLDRKLEQLTSLKELATTVTPALSGMPSGSRDGHKNESVLIRIADLSTELNRMVDELVDLKAEMLERIYELESSEERRVLEYRYVRLLSWEDVASALKLSERNVFRIHRNALGHFSASRNWQ